ncbi:MAG: hydrolase [Candidatus Coatesbacteria bacterium]|nr:MAG: hydrolase [Candidatus Coatesbacteria bacterium]
MPKLDEYYRNVGILIKAFRRLGAPVVVTEQYAKGLGPTVPEIASALGEFEPVEKMTFSCAGEPKYVEALRATGADQAVLCGMETHVCVQQTALDLSAAGYQVHVAADAVRSRKKQDWAFSLERMRQAGIIITTTEATVFEMLVECGTDEFKDISKLIR